MVNILQIYGGNIKKFKAGQTVYVITELVDAEWNFVGVDIRKYFITEKDPGPCTRVAFRRLINKLPELWYFCTTSRPYQDWNNINQF